jgi:hypothetical protein
MNEFQKFGRLANDNIPERLHRIGKIHLGIRDEAKGYPKKTDYFVCPPEVHAVYGERPRSLDIVIPHENPVELFPYEYKCYRAGIGLDCHGDGVRAQRRDAGKWKDLPCPCERLGAKGKGELACKMMGNLYFFLPLISFGGVYQIDTSSEISKRNIITGLQAVEAMAGHLLHVPAVLTLDPVEVAPAGKKITVYCLNIQIPTHERALKITGEVRAIRAALGGTTLKALPAPNPDKFEETDLINPEVLDAEVIDPVTGEVQGWTDPAPEPPATATPPAQTTSTRGEAPPESRYSQDGPAGMEEHPPFEDTPGDYGPGPEDTAPAWTPTDKQKGLLKALSRKVGLDGDKWHAFLIQEAGVDSSTKLDRAGFDRVVEAMKAADKAGEKINPLVGFGSYQPNAPTKAPEKAQDEPKGPAPTLPLDAPTVQHKHDIVDRLLAAIDKARTTPAAVKARHGVTNLIDLSDETIEAEIKRLEGK